MRNVICHSILDPSEVLHYMDTDWQNIVTPIKPNILRRLLIQSKYDSKCTEELYQGLTKGFDIGYRGSYQRKHMSSNLPFKIGTPTDLWNKVMKEVKENCYAGPFEYPLCENYVQSPLGLVPKSGGKMRLIFHLSYDFGEDQHERSINELTPDELCSVKYRDLDHAVRNCIRLLKIAEENSSLFFSKTDCSHAFRLVTVLVQQRFLLVMMAVHPITQKKWYFIDKCLPFGSSRSCAIFQKFSDALAHIISFRLTVKNITSILTLSNYLDDFIFIALCIAVCNHMLCKFLCLCKEVGCPISEDKTEYAAPVMVFLGTLLNGQQMIISLPLEKITKAYNLIQYAIQKRKVTIKFVQQLTGVLNFLHKAIIPGRAFTRGMYSRLKLKDSKGRLLKQHHHIYLNAEFINDWRVWLTFLANAHSTQLCRPFADFDPEMQLTILEFFSDALLSSKLGFGAFFRNRWMYGQWDTTFITECKPSIEFLELFALVAALTAWNKDRQLINARVGIFCDNEAVMHMVNSLASSCPQCMKLIRIIALQRIAFNRRVKVLYQIM